VLAEREVLPIGATRPVSVNLRVVAATHCNLVAAVKAGAFRDDLYYRLNGVHFHLPALRERQDLEVLIQQLCARGETTVRLSDEALQVLLMHDWPGNVRELCNVIDCARALCSDGFVSLDDLPEYLVRRPPGHLSGLWIPHSVALTSKSLEEIEDSQELGIGDLKKPFTKTVANSGHGQTDRQPDPDPVDVLRDALRLSGWNMTATARRLGVSRMTLYRRMERLGLRTPNQTDGFAADNEISS
jgi:transcriptional regulator of acetoin/glycerol metabolism